MKSAKVFLILTFVGALASLGLGIAVVSQKNELKQNLDDTSSKLKNTSDTLDKTKKDLATSETSLKETSSALTEAKTKGEELQTSLSKAESKVTELGKSLTEATESVNTAQKRLKEVDDALGGADPVKLKADALQAQSDLTALQREKKIIDDKLAAASAEVARITDIIERTKRVEMPPGINGKVTAVNKAWNFVVLNIGLRDGVVENGILMVYRGDKLLGKVKVVSAEDHASVADIIPEWVKGTIQAGDDAFN